MSDSQVRRQLHTVKDVREATRLSHATVWRLIDRGVLQTVSIGRRRLITDSSLQRLIEAGAPKVGEAA